MRYLAFLLLLVSIATVTCRLKIISPDDLKKAINTDAGIPFQLAKYGNIPYGSNLVGTLKMANPEDGCSSLLQSQNDEKGIQNLILVVRRGNCKYTVKTRYAQLAGAKMLIVIGDSEELGSPPIGYDADSISIPTILIRKSDGDSIVDALKDAEESHASSPDAYVIASMTFPYDLTDEVSVDFWFSSTDSTEVVYKFLKEFKPFYLQSKAFLNFRPHYVTWYSASSKYEDHRNAHADCLSGGRYCAHHPDSTTGLTGADVVYEDLRQICIWKNFADLWWDYVEKFSENCSNKKDQRACAEKALSDIGMSSGQIDTVHKCVDDSFFKRTGETSEPINQNIDDNTLLSEEFMLQEEYDVSVFPSLFINHHIYQGELREGAPVFRAACESLVAPTDLCLEYALDNSTSHISTGTIVIIVVILVLVVLIALFFYRRMVKREMNKEMNIQVSQMVSQYFALNESRRLRDNL